MEQTEAVEMLKSQLKINTTNPPGNEAEAAEALAAIFTKAGIPVKLLPYADGRTQLMATLEGEQEGKNLTFTGHLDVVPVGELPWEHEPFGAEEADGKIYGRGASDMKSGLVAMACAMLQLKEEQAPLKGKLTFIATVGEETSSIGAQQLVEQGYADHLDAMLIGEPTGNEISIAEKGCLWLRLTTYGRTGHGSTPEYGVNANEHMIALLSRFQSQFTFEFEPDDLLSEPSSSIDVLHGGSGTNVIPDRCTVEIDMRTLPSQNHQDIVLAVRQMIDSVRKDIPDLKAEITILNDMCPVKTSKEDPFVQLLISTVEEVSQRSVEPYGFSGYTDGAYFSQAEEKFPIAVVGPGYPPVAHQPDEYVEKTVFFQAIEIYKTVAAKFLK
ncbi:MAG: M20 family metallopeptidase [Sporolactobacillus sp.]